MRRRQSCTGKRRVKRQGAACHDVETAGRVDGRALGTEEVEHALVAAICSIRASAKRIRPQRDGRHPTQPIQQEFAKNQAAGRARGAPATGSARGTTAPVSGASAPADDVVGPRVVGAVNLLLRVGIVGVLTEDCGKG